MSFSLRPHIKFGRVEDITPEFLHSIGAKLLILDVDNTIAPYGTLVLSPSVMEWAGSVKASGVGLYIVSNNKGERPEVFARLLGCEYIKRAGKPSPRGVKEALRRTGVDAASAALVGDQIYTDTIAANLAGVRMILVEPIRFTNIFLRIRYYLEIPFRRAKSKE